MKLSNAKLAGITGGIGLGMLGLAFASEPLYNTFCKVTGFGGTTRIATEAPTRIVEREVTVRFDANVRAPEVRFRPLQLTQKVHLGEHGLAFYEATNFSDHPVTLIASYNVTPHKAGPYFNKLECFCFTERILPAGETVKLPVVYFVSPDMEEGGNVDDVKTITLSYTFYESRAYKGPRDKAPTDKLDVYQ